MGPAVGVVFYVLAHREGAIGWEYFDHVPLSVHMFKMLPPPPAVARFRTFNDSSEDEQSNHRDSSGGGSFGGVPMPVFPGVLPSTPGGPAQHYHLSMFN